MGTKRLTKVMAGLETTHGTAVAADTRLYMMVDLPDQDRENHVPQVDAGHRTPGLLKAANVRRVLAEFPLSDMDGAYFELFPLLFSCSIKHGTGTNGGAGDYTWTFLTPQTASETIDSMTLEYGDDSKAYETAYVMLPEIVVTGDCDTGEVHVTAQAFGDMVAQTTFSVTISEPTAMEMCNAKLARVYVDDTWAGLGTTHFTDSLAGFTVTLRPGAHPKHLGDTTRLISTHNQGEITGTMELTLERNSTVVAEELHYRPADEDTAPPPRFIRLDIAGTAIGTGSARYLRFDMAGVWSNWDSMGDERNGNNLDNVTLMAGYDSTSGNAISAAVLCAQAAI